MIGIFKASGHARDVPMIVPVNVVLFGAFAAGVSLASPLATTISCAAILLFGLPHGTLDLELLKLQHRGGPGRMSATLLLYLALAAATYGLWNVAPVAALAVFLVTAVIHFAEDWEDAPSAFLAQGMSVSLLTAPTFLHLSEMQGLFVALSGRAQAAVLGDVMLLLAPASLAVAAVTLLSHWQSGRREPAFVGMAVIAGMMLLPPAIGFAAFFCLYHSPRHFRAALAGLSDDQFRRRWHVVLPLTFAALGIAVWLFTGQARAGFPARMIAASFMTLSILTVPHMAVPVIVALLPTHLFTRSKDERVGPADPSRDAGGSGKRAPTRSRTPHFLRKSTSPRRFTSSFSNVTGWKYASTRLPDGSVP